MHAKPNRQSEIERNLYDLCQANFQSHPFSTLNDTENLEWVLSNYLAMSQAFPFLQAGAQRELIFDVIKRGQDIPPHYEITASVMNFLCWDETGGHHAVLSKGNEGLPNILETDKRFHANILKADLITIFDKKVYANYSCLTKAYLLTLYSHLSALNSVQRVASMVAFERHAQQMITALWLRLSELLHIDKNELLYFKIHVGETDPAEAYHVELTFRMIESIISAEAEIDFYKYFVESYALSFNWCRDLVNAAQKVKYA